MERYTRIISGRADTVWSLDEIYFSLYEIVEGKRAYDFSNVMWVYML